MPDPLISWISIGLLLLFLFFFSGAETALACCNHYKIQVEADEGKNYAKKLVKILDNYDRALTTVLIGNNITAIAITAITTTLFLYYFKDTSFSQYNISLVVSIVITFVIFILGDALPKTISRLIPDTMSKIYTYPIYFLMLIFTPITILFDLAMRGMEKLLKVKNQEELTEEDFSDVVDKAGEEEMIDEEQAEIVLSTLDYLDTNVKQVLTPRDKMVTYNIKDLTNDALKDIILNTNFSRIPIYDKVFDNIIGVLVLKIYLEEYALDPHVDVRSVLQKPYFVSSSIMIDDLFKGFKKHHTHIALVRDNHNKIIGMVTMEDILEEIVSDIAEPSLNKRRVK